MTQIQAGNGIGANKNRVEMAESYAAMEMAGKRTGLTGGVKPEDDSFDVAKNIRYDKGQKQGFSETVMNNFNEYRKDMLERAKEQGEDNASDEHERNEQRREIARNLSGSERKMLEQMGYDVDSMDLSDLVNVVGKLKSDAHKEALAEVLAMAKVNQGDLDGLTLLSGTVSASGVELSNVSLSDVVQQEQHGPEAQAGQDELQVGVREFLYLEKNQLPVNRENLYKAHYSGQQEKEQEIPEEIETQLARIVEQAGLAGNEDALAGAKLLFSNDMPVTPDSLRDYMAFRPYFGAEIESVKTREQAEMEMEPKTAELLGERLYAEVKGVSVLAVYDMASENRAVTIASARTYTEQHRDRYTDDAYVERRMRELALADGEEGLARRASYEGADINAVSAMRQMEEIRLMMTEQAAYRMMKLDVNIDTRELSQVISELRGLEQRMTLAAFSEAGVAPTEENLSVYEAMQQGVQNIGNAPVEGLGLLMKGTSFTVREFAVSLREFSADAQTGEQSIGKAAFETIRRSYEAVGTAPRADMGDSIRKAFRNVGDILQEMNLPESEDNLRAVKILGYNSIEITEENIREVVNYDRQVNDMMDAFYPEAVLSMIKEGINPMDMPIPELTSKIRAKNYNRGVTEAKNFATYLRDVEKRGEITPEERQSYIGMFRMMDKLAKSGDREAGFLFANGSRLTVRNLLAAMRSRRDAGLDVSIDDDFGMLSEVNISGAAIDTQIESAFSPFGRTEDTGTSPEENVGQEMQVARFMEENQIPVSLLSTQACAMLMEDGSAFYELVADLMKTLRFEDNSKENLVDEETGNMAASLAGEDTPIDVLLDNPAEHMLEKLLGSEEMSLTYEDLQNELIERMYIGGGQGTITAEDLASVRLVQAGFSVLGRMARQDKYQLPVQTQQGVQMVNLTVAHGQEKGTVEIRMEKAQLGSLTAKLVLRQDGSLFGHVVSDSSEGNLALAERQGAVTEALAAKGYADSELSLGQIQGRPLGAGGETAGAKTSDIYQCAVSLVQLLADL